MKEQARYMSAEKVVFAAELAERIAALKAEEHALYVRLLQGKPSPEETVQIIWRKHACILEQTLLMRRESVGISH